MARIIAGPRFSACARRRRSGGSRRRAVRVLEAAFRRLPADARVAGAREAGCDDPVQQRSLHQLLPRHRSHLCDRGRRASTRSRTKAGASVRCPKCPGIRISLAHLSHHLVDGWLRPVDLPSPAARPWLPVAAVRTDAESAALARRGRADPGERAALSDSDAGAMLRARPGDPARGRELRGRSEGGGASARAAFRTSSRASATVTSIPSGTRSSSTGSSPTPSRSRACHIRISSSAAARKVSR